MYGEGQTRGRVAALRIAAATNQALAAIQVKPDGLVLRDFLMWFLRAQYFQLREKAAGGVQPNLNLGIVKSFMLPVPSHHEQAEIIRHIDASAPLPDSRHCKNEMNGEAIAHHPDITTSTAARAGKRHRACGQCGK
jgi:Type I restriction modification DNA specificity domain